MPERIWIPIDKNDRDGRPIFVGALMEFDVKEWGSDDNRFTVGLASGEVTAYGTAYDLGQWCKVIDSPGIPVRRTALPARLAEPSGVPVLHEVKA